MLDSTFELVTGAASNSPLCAFCFCNLIIVILLLLPKPDLEIDGGLHTAPTSVALIDEKRGALPENFQVKKGDTLVDAGEELDEKNDTVGHIDDVGEHVNANSNPIDDSEGSSEDENNALVNVSEDSDVDDEDEDEDADELRRRVEEFIEKVNRGWRAESPKFATTNGNSRVLW